MDPEKDLDNQGTSNAFSRNSKAFDQCISVLFEEIQLAIKWNRPSILLAIHTSKIGQEKAQKSLQNKLFNPSKNIVYIRPGGLQDDLFRFIEQTKKPDQFIYFVEGIGRDKKTYHALNLRREELIEKKLIVVFWLTDSEAKELPYFAPDFWAFRHRVVEFAPSRGSGKRALPSGILIWQAENPYWIYESVEKKIAFQKELLHKLPLTDEALIIRSEATYTLAGIYWLTGEIQKAKELLQEEMNNLARVEVPDIVAMSLNGLAIILYDQKKFDEALEFLNQAITLNPGNNVLLANLAVVYHALGKSEKALRTIERVIEPAPYLSWSWYILGHINLSLGKLDRALASFEESFNLNNGTVFAGYAIAVCHGLMGNLDEQKKFLQRLGTDSLKLSTYHEICMNALLGEEAALDKLRSALMNGQITPLFLKRDPIINIIFDDLTMQSLV